MAEVIWTKRAFGQFQRAVKFIFEKQGYSYAETVRNKIIESTNLLKDNPYMGAIEPLLTHKNLEYRFLVVWGYKIIYRATDERVIVSRVFHTSRNPKKLRGV